MKRKGENPQMSRWAIAMAHVLLLRLFRDMPDPRMVGKVLAALDPDAFERRIQLLNWTCSIGPQPTVLR
jgi:hypothetical protein